MKILISPYVQKMRNGMPSAKQYPVEEWLEVVSRLEGCEIVQIGVEGEPKLVKDHRRNLKMFEVKNLLQWCDVWVSCDSFLQHLAHHLRKPGVVIWSASDPKIFGYSYNVNLLKSREYLRRDQFGIWESEGFRKDAFVDSDTVVKAILGFSP